MRAMQIAQIKAIRAKGEADHPYWWGSFVAVGDWR